MVMHFIFDRAVYNRYDTMKRNRFVKIEGVDARYGTPSIRIFSDGQ